MKTNYYPLTLFLEVMLAGAVLLFVIETLRNVWLNWGWSYPYTSSPVWAVVGIAFWWGFGFLMWASTPKEKPPSATATMSDSSPTNPPQNINVTSYNQQSGITAGIVNIQQGSTSKDSKLRSENVEQQKQADGSFLTTATLILDSSFPIGNLYLEVRGRSIDGLEVVPMKTGVFMQGHSGKREDYFFTNIPNASGQYQMQIRSTDAEKFEIIYNVD